MNHLNFIQALEDLAPPAALHGPSDHRCAALERLKALDPLRSQEEWQFLSPRPFFELPPNVSSNAADAAPDELALADCLTLTFEDGQLVGEVGANLAEGLLITPLDQALAADPERLKALLDLPDSDSRHALTDLVSAFSAGSLMIEVKDGHTLKRPLRLLYRQSTRGRFSAHQHLLVIGRNAEATVIEAFHGPDHRPYISASMCRIHLEENARLDHYKQQLEGNEARHFGGLYITQKQNSSFRQIHVALGGRFARTEIHSLIETGAECHLEGSFVARDQSLIDTHTRLRHRGHHATSRNHYHGMAMGKGRGIFQGRIIVEPGAQLTDAVMQSRNLLLSEEAVIDAKPQLEIHADDVKCAHGVTIGQIDAEQVFYLTSRGLDHADALRILTLGFASTVLDQIRPDALREQIKAQIHHAMETALLVEDPS